MVTVARDVAITVRDLHHEPVAVTLCRVSHHAARHRNHLGGASAKTAVGKDRQNNIPTQLANTRRLILLPA